MDYMRVREAPEKRRSHATGGKEHYLGEGGVMLAFAMHLLETEQEVSVHPDGLHAKDFDIPRWMESRGFEKVESMGGTAYAGRYRRQGQVITINPKSGIFDVASPLVVAECKGGVLNTKHPGQVSRLRRGLCEAVGLLMASPSSGKREVAVVPDTAATRALAMRLKPRCAVAGIEVALVDGQGQVHFI